MKQSEELFDKFAKKNMVQWNQASFKRTHDALHKSIIEAIDEALLTDRYVQGFTSEDMLGFANYLRNGISNLEDSQKEISEHLFDWLKIDASKL
jgi:hypothetical protein